MLKEKVSTVYKVDKLDPVLALPSHKVAELALPSVQVTAF